MTKIERLRAELKQARTAAYLFEALWHASEREGDELRTQLKRLQVIMRLEEETIPE